MGKKYGTLIICASILVLCFTGTASAETWYVDDEGGADFTGIQDAIDNASDGDTIIVHSGIYYENVVVDKSVTLKGNGQPVVDASGEWSAIRLTVDGITLVGFTATNAGSSWQDKDAGIKVISSNNTITGNNASHNNRGGICLWDSSNNNTITGNNASHNNRGGIELYGSSNNTITGNVFVYDGLSVYSSYQNIVEDNTVNGKPLVYLEDVSDYKVENAGQVIIVNCNNITIENLDLSNTSGGVTLWKTENSKISNNTVCNNNRGGIRLDNSSNNNTITGNNVSSNKWEGIGLWDSSNNNTITGNNVRNNWEGIRLDNSSNNNTITGNNVSSNKWEGIKLDDSSNNNTITGNNVRNNWKGILLYGSSNNNTITGNNVSSNKWEGIGLWDSSNNNTITGNNVSNNDGGGIFLRSDCSNNTITGNVFVNDGLFVYSSYQNIGEDNTVNGKPLVYLEDVSDCKVEDAGQVIIVNCNNITIENLDLSNTSGGVTLWKTENSKISNNTVCNNNRDGIRLSYSSNNIITGNNVSNNDDDGIDLYGSSNNTITGNNVSSNKWEGIELDDSSNNNTITGNNVSNNNKNGIDLSHSSNNTITGNNASNNREDGIRLWYSSNNIITGNNVSNNNRDGIYLDYLSNDNTITGNNVSNNNWKGLRLYGSSNNTITGNNVSNNRGGIYLSYFSNNTIYFNNFIDNIDNVYSSESTNAWNSTSKITYTYNGTTYANYLGNYWDDYTDVDANNDGIWDHPRSINPDQDYHPLVAPFENYFVSTPSFF